MMLISIWEFIILVSLLLSIFEIFYNKKHVNDISKFWRKGYSVNGVRVIVCVFEEGVRFFFSTKYKINFGKIKDLSAKQKIIENWENIEFFCIVQMAS